ncbi:MAG TPA: glycosyltransferase [Actinophytocola sp.]|uniref:glycosyltransferase family 2 protein n=1 Tax=Actinophytocola sp. TaxID=1872138 RepID=UPI002DBECC32|nr:glycosyltransferase [Actinophytocola sp.]HEU5474844.1 glycosyltransferase [Actinophytocola sp.]
MCVHIVVAYYLEPRYLFELIESVRKQTCDDWRLTIVDDRYPGTAARDYVAELGDPRIEWVQNERNLGTSGNMCRCMTQGRLKYVTAMGADDALEPNYVETMLRAFERHPNAIMVHPWVTVVDADGALTDSLVDRIKRLMSRSAWRTGELAGPAAVRSLMRGNWLYCPAMCFRTDVVPRAEPMGEFASIADLAWVVDMLLGGGTLVLDPTPAFRYRRHQASHSSQHAKSLARFTEEQRYYAATAAKLRAHGWTTAARAAQLHVTTRLHALRAALGALADRDPRLAFALFRLSVRRIR